MERWRRLYRQARATLSRATQEIESGTYSLGSKEYKQAKRNQDQATRQLDLLKNDMKGSFNQLSEFYPYRYLGFRRLPARLQLHAIAASGLHSRWAMPVSTFPVLVSLHCESSGPATSSITAGRSTRFVSWSCRMPKAICRKQRSASTLVTSCAINQKDLELCPFTGVSLSDNKQVRVSA